MGNLLQGLRYGIRLLLRKPGVRLEDADRDVAALIDEFGRLQNWPRDDGWTGPQVVPLILFGAAGLVLLIACANIANLDEDARYYLYMPAPQETQWSTYLVVRTLSDPEAIVSAVRSQVSALDHLRGARLA